MNTTHLDQFTRAYTGNGATITGKCPHCGNVEQFHGMDMRPQFFDECKPFCGNCAEFYLLKDNIGDDGQVHGSPLTAVTPVESEAGKSQHLDLTHNGRQSARTVVPCNCGNPNAHWRWPRTGRRSYLCDDCAAAMVKFGTALAEEMLRD